MLKVGDVPTAVPCRVPRAIYAHTFGPTIGDRVRLGDTDLTIEVEADYTVYGDELKFGGGKVKDMYQCYCGIS